MDLNMGFFRYATFRNPPGAGLNAGTTLGMMIVNVPTVLFAERATKWVPLKVVRIVAALIYAILGIITLLGYSRVSL